MTNRKFYKVDFLKIIMGLITKLPIVKSQEAIQEWYERSKTEENYPDNFLARLADQDHHLNNYFVLPFLASDRDFLYIMGGAFVYDVLSSQGELPRTKNSFSEDQDPVEILSGHFSLPFNDLSRIDSSGAFKDIFGAMRERNNELATGFYRIPEFKPEDDDFPLQTPSLGLARMYGYLEKLAEYNRSHSC